MATYGSYVFYVTDNCYFNNNIFAIQVTNYPYTYSGGGCIFNNNIFTDGPYWPLPGTDFNTQWLVSPATIFVSQSGYSYNSTNDYHVQNSSIAHLYGTDNTDCGIYGTAVPYKQGGVPYNPHIKVSSIGTSTDSQGHLPLNIHVSAQGN